MARNVLHRDFSLSRAIILAALIGLAFLIGEVPTHAHDDDEEAGNPMMQRATVLVVAKPCDTWSGVRL